MSTRTYTRAQRAKAREERKKLCLRQDCSFFNSGNDFCSNCTAEWNDYDGPMTEFMKTRTLPPKWLSEFVERLPRPSGYELSAVHHMCSRATTPTEVYLIMKSIFINTDTGYYVTMPTVEQLIPILRSISQYRLNPQINYKWEHAVFCYASDYYNIPMDFPTSVCYLGNFGEKPKTERELFLKMRQNLHFIRDQLIRFS
jgi:hypothetical protein